MIGFTVTGSTTRTQKFLQTIIGRDLFSDLDAAGRRGVEALRAATPVDSGLTAASWSYNIKKEGDSYTISWTNSNRVNGVLIAVILQYGHGTGTGGYVAGRDYINPAIQPIFEQITNDVWRKVTQA